MTDRCTEKCWTRVPCPTCGCLLVPRGRDGGMAENHGYCCEEVKYTAHNTAHLWHVHDSTRWYTDPEGWNEHAASCDQDCEPIPAAPVQDGEGS